MKKQAIYIILILLITFTSFSLPSKSPDDTFNYTDVKNKISYLSSPNFKGRLAGTVENTETAQYIKTVFQNENLKPYKGSYYQNFQVAYPKKTDNSPYLQVVSSNGSIVHSFKYNTDYREDMLNFKKNSIEFKNGSNVHIQKSSITVSNNNNIFLFYASENDNIQFRSSFFNDSYISMCIITTSKTLETIKNYLSQGYTIKSYSPYIVENTSVNNVIGVVEGKNKNLPPLIISAHFDHVGTDIAGNVYSGALDNASGTAFMLEMIKYVKSLGTPSRDILFIAFNAEEYGCLGSKAFVDANKNNLRGSKVFNFDMIGSDYGVPLCIMGAKNDTSNTALIKSTADICANNKIHFNYLFQDSSDHEYFRKNNIEAITFCDNDTSKIHTPLDKSNYISENAIKRCFKIASTEVLQYGFTNGLLLQYTNRILKFSLLLLAICLTIIIFVKHMRENKKQTFSINQIKRLNK